MQRNSQQKAGQGLFTNLIGSFMDFFEEEDTGNKKNSGKGEYYKNPFGGFLP